MKVELHLHTCRYSGCARATPTELMGKLISAGYEAVFITEHDAIWRDWELDHLQSEFPDIRIFPGMELSLGNDVMPLQHLLVLGANDPEYLLMGDLAEILDKARAAGHLTVLAHPARWPGGAQMLEEGLLPDALEYYTGSHTPPQAAQAAEIAARLRLPLVNSGDVHALDFIDRFWIETDRPLEKRGDIRSIVLSGAYANHPRDDK